LRRYEEVGLLREAVSADTREKAMAALSAALSGGGNGAAAAAAVGLACHHPPSLCTGILPTRSVLCDY